MLFFAGAGLDACAQQVAEPLRRRKLSLRDLRDPGDEVALVGIVVEVKAEYASHPRDPTGRNLVSFAVSLSQLLLALVFAVAGVAKLADRSGTRRAI
ncbi:MAG TPA: hypothetical protein VHM66_04820, partial [Solirubrobacterales bacterium]|nr:hypothetical protein [Solirubrobacterales bacterium]